MHYRIVIAWPARQVVVVVVVMVVSCQSACRQADCLLSVVYVLCLLYNHSA